MTKDEEVLLSNLLNSLDRLYDCECGAFDLYALSLATSKALASSQFRAPIESVVDTLLSIVRTKETGDLRRDAAIIATDELRRFLADALPKPE